VDKLPGRSVHRVGHPGPAASHDDARLPGIGQHPVGNGVLGGQVVLVLAGHGPVDDDDAGLYLPHFLHQLIHADVLALDVHELVIRPVDVPADLLRRHLRHPAPVEPQDVERTIVRHQLGDLVVGELDVLLPAVGIAFYIVVHVPVGRGEVGPPVILAMPVGLGEIGARPQPLLPKGPEDLPGDVRPGIAAERAFRAGDLVIGVFGVEHAEAVVVLGGEHDVTHAGLAGGFGPPVRVEPVRVEGGLQVFIFLLVLGVVFILSPAPAFVFRADGPGLHDAPLAVRPPVHQQAELQVLPLLQLLLYQGIGVGHIGLLMLGMQGN